MLVLVELLLLPADFKGILLTSSLVVVEFSGFCCELLFERVVLESIIIIPKSWSIHKWFDSDETMQLTQHIYLTWRESSRDFSEDEGKGYFEHEQKKEKN